MMMNIIMMMISTPNIRRKFNSIQFNNTLVISQGANSIMKAMHSGVILPNQDRLLLLVGVVALLVFFVVDWVFKIKYMYYIYYYY